MLCIGTWIYNESLSSDKLLSANANMLLSVDIAIVAELEPTCKSDMKKYSNSESGGRKGILCVLDGKNIVLLIIVEVMQYWGIIGCI